MHILIATEIWGRTLHIDRMAEAFRPHAGHVTIVDPYGGTDPGFTREDEAYSAFLVTCPQFMFRAYVSLHSSC